MNFDRAALKRQARQDMQKKRPSVLLVSFVYLLLTTGVSFAVSQVSFAPLYDLLSTAAVEEMSGEEFVLFLREWGPELLPALGMGVGLTLLVGIFACILQFGYTVYTLDLARGQKAGFGSLLSGFGMLGRVLGLNIVIGVFTLLWALAILVPAVGLEVLAAWLFINVLDMEWLAWLVMYLLLAAAYVLLFARVLRYAMAQRTLADRPEAGVMAAIARSKELMAGRRWELVKLVLSFFGWFLAEYLILMAVLYVGIFAVIFVAEVAYISGAATEAQLLEQLQALAKYSWVLLAAAEFAVTLFNMWLMPYMTVTEAHFYLAISGQQVPEPLPVGTWTRRPEGGGQPPVPPAPPAPPRFPAERPFTPPPEEPSAPGFAEGEAVPGPSGAGEDAPAGVGTPGGGEPETPASAAEDVLPAGQPAEPRCEDPWDRPADSRRNPDDPF